MARKLFEVGDVLPTSTPVLPYLTFQSTGSFTLKTANNQKNWNGTLYYSTDTTTWVEWDGTTTLSSVDNKLYLRGSGNTKITGWSSDSRWVLTGSNIKCIGNIENLLDWETVALGNHPTMVGYCYAYMFSGCTSLTTPPDLPATILANACYTSMFNGCTALTTAPSLPATTLLEYCYQNMFRECTSLTTAPSLPATTLAYGCYDSMFRDCTALKVSATKTGSYQYAWRIPASGTGTEATNWNNNMLYNTGGTFKSNPSINTTYYVENPPVEYLAPTPSGYSITFEENGGTEQTDLTEQIALPDPLPTPTKSGYTFLGWYYDSSFTNAAVAGDSLSSDVTLYAKWQLNTYTITYNSNGGSSIPQSSGVTQLPDPLPIPTRTGYYFQGWFYDSDFTIEALAGDSLTSDVTLYAKWYDLSIGKLYKGDSDVSNQYEKIYKGSELLWEKQTTPPVITYLTFQSASNFTLNVYDNTKHWDGTLYYSTDTTTWNVWSGTTTLSSVGNKLYLRGTGNTIITGSTYSSPCRWVFTGSNIECIGNIENLLDYETVASGNHPTMADYCYSYMFYGCTALTTAPELPATTLADDCYSYMFYGCTSLTTAPQLPATTLANSCYHSMFRGCTGLTTAPSLPVTTLAPYCYRNMFQSCTGLTTAPELPATTLASYCYNGMFQSCTGLTTAPSLPAATLAPYCYYSMFEGCIGLTTAPSLPATTLASSCYDSMFEGCTGLTTAPELPATTLVSYCYYSMFRDCTSLTTAPSLPATTLDSRCYEYMFRGCTGLTTVPNLPATTLASYCYREMFRDCTSLKISSTPTGAYQYAWRIPTSGIGTEASDWNSNMFSGTGGTFRSNPSINTTYYVENPPV